MSGMWRTIEGLRPELQAQAKRKLAELPARVVRPMGPQSTGGRFVHVRRQCVNRTPMDRVLWFASKLGLEKPTLEHRFHPVRRWRFDAAWVPQKIAIEIEGLSNKISRHTTIKGYRNDCRKYNAANVLRWHVLRFTQDMVESGEAYRTMEEAFGKTRRGEPCSQQPLR